MGHLTEENYINMVFVDGLTVTWAVMLPQKDFTACQEKFLELAVDGVLLR